MKKIFVVLCLLVMALTFTGCSGVIRMHSYKNSEKYSVGNKEYSGEIKKLNIDWYVGRVKIVISDKISISENSNDLKDKQKVHSYFEDGVLDVKFWESGYSAKINDADKHVTIEIPNGVDISINSISALITTDDIENNNIDIKTVSGNIDISSLVSKSVNIYSVSGSITIDKVVCDKLEMESVSGGIETLDTTTKNIKVNTVSGKIYVSLRDFIDADFDSVSAKVNVKLLDELGMMIKFKTTSGELIVDNENISFKIVDKKYKIGDGSRNLDVKTTSGDFHLR